MLTCARSCIVLLLAALMSIYIMGYSTHNLFTSLLTLFFSAIAWRQATNWASRQGFTDGVRTQV